MKRCFMVLIYSPKALLLSSVANVSNPVNQIRHVGNILSVWLNNESKKQVHSWGMVVPTNT